MRAVGPCHRLHEPVRRDAGVSAQRGGGVDVAEQADGAAPGLDEVGGELVESADEARSTARPQLPEEPAGVHQGRLDGVTGGSGVATTGGGVRGVAGHDEGLDRPVVQRVGHLVAVLIELLGGGRGEREAQHGGRAAQRRELGGGGPAGDEHAEPGAGAAEHRDVDRGEAVGDGARHQAAGAVAQADRSEAEPGLEGLQRLPGNAYGISPESGAVSINAPGAAGTGAVSAYSLEASNVDLAQEFTNMIKFQRAYSASSKIITTVDEMLQEVNNLKR